MSRNWTDNQKLAIDARRGSLLVSAAAGSGKTAVLVERVISMITDNENPVPIDKLLIVTFTVAAAKELKERISLTLQELISKNPDNHWYRRQLVYLPYATISTVDSFCSSIVREFSQVIGVSGDYKIGESGELELLVNESVDETIELMYSQNSKDFYELVETYAAAKNDISIGTHIYTLYKFLRSHPFSDGWLDEKLSYYEDVTDMSKSIWGEIIRNYAMSAVEYSVELTNTSIRIVEEIPELASKAFAIFQSDIDFYELLLTSLKSDSWDTIRNLIKSYKAKTYRVDGFKDHPLKIKAGKIRDMAKDNIKELNLLFFRSEEEALDEIKALTPIVRKLFESVKTFGEIYSKKKAEHNLADFNDLSHWMLKLLVKRDNDGNVELTEHANMIAERFHEVMVDEYQDANEVQDLIYYAVSRKGTNLFTVGDVKQSIYGFRQAMPEIFLSRKNSLPLYSRELDNYPSKVILEKNFRSRKEVTSFINFAFSLLMSEDVGDLVYNEEEALDPQAPYPEADSPCCELHLIDMDEMEDLDKSVVEARHIGEMILRMCKDTYITDKGEKRLARYGDFSIIMRKKERYAQVYASELKKMGIPAMTDVTMSFLSYQEITLVLDLLRVIDNPLQDVPMTATLMSPLFGFTPDDMVEMRLSKRHRNIYNALKSYAENGNVKAQRFIEMLDLFRNIAVTEPCDVFISKLYEELHIPAIASAAWGKASALNLRLLITYAEKFEQNSSKGISAFVNYLSRLEEQGTYISAAIDSGSTDMNVVNIMSVHSSKGLEFPICIIANMGRFFSTDTSKNILLHSKLGFASKLRNKEVSCNYTTVAREAVSLEVDRSEKSEELRVLYVAMTRAKERLIMVASHKRLRPFVQKIASRLTSGSKIPPFVVRDCTYLSEWPVMCALMHPNGNDLRDYADMDEPEVFMCENTSNLKTVIVTSLNGETANNDRDFAFQVTSAVTYEAIPSDSEEIIKRRFDYRYPYMELSKVPQKVTASELAHSNSDKPLERVLPVPSFIKENKVTGVMRGTAMHTYLEYCDFKLAREDISKDIERIRSLGYLSEDQVSLLDVDKLKSFIGSRIVTDALSAENYLREYRFTVNIPASLVNEDISPEFSDASVVLQGAVDLIIVDKDGVTVVDYKTDRVKSSDELVRMYSKQLALYKEAVSQVLSKPVKSCLIYSVHLCEIKEV